MDLTFVFPCLDEAETLADCIAEVKAGLEGSGIEWEIVVSDNGSTDGSQEIARKCGARVVDAPIRGYGAALNAGITAAKGKWVSFADADGSYRVGEIMQLYNKAMETDPDMVIASRMIGEIEPGAMPFLHRRLGTPVLTTLINLFYKGKLSDCNSGFRLLRRENYPKLNVRGTGMEYASELLIKSLKANSKMVEIPMGLRPDKRSREPHLQTWRDGMRHLLFIFSERPEFFERTGGLLLVLSTILQIVAFVMGPTVVGSVTIFDFHSQALLLPVACTGLQLYLLSCYMYMTDDTGATGITKKLIHVGEAELFFSLVAMGAAEVLALVYVFWRWGQSDFGSLEGPGLIRLILFLVHLMTVLGFFAAGLLGIHIFKKRNG